MENEIQPYGGYDLRTARRQFSRLGLGAFVIFVVTVVLQTAALVILFFVNPRRTIPSWLIWVLNFVPMYLVAVPLGLLVMRTVPATPIRPERLSPGQLAVTALICVFLMYAGNLLGTLVLSAIQAAFGFSAQNPVEELALNSDAWVRLLIMAILAPIIEEYIFRKQLIDRMNAYGQKLAVVTSALMFGLFHGNLSQFFYAFALGLVFGYVYLKTGRLRYTIGLHMFVNFLGGVIAPMLLESVDLSALESADSAEALQVLLSPQIMLLYAYSIIMIGMAIAGLVLFILRCRKTRFAPAEAELPKGTKFKTAYLNVGMILLIVVCLLEVVLTFV